MTQELSPQQLIQDLCRRDQRYPFEAYEFVFSALGYVQQEMKKQGQVKEGAQHVSGQQLATGCRDFAVQEFGMMAGTVLKSWNIHQTDDFGEIVYNLIESQLMTRTDTDSKEDFRQVFDLHKTVSQGFEFKLD